MMFTFYSRLQFTIICPTALSMVASTGWRGSRPENGVSSETSRIRRLRTTRSQATEEWSLGQWKLIFNQICYFCIAAILWQLPQTTKKTTITLEEVTSLHSPKPPPPLLQPCFRALPAKGLLWEVSPLREPTFRGLLWLSPILTSSAPTSNYTSDNLTLLWYLSLFFVTF